MKHILMATILLLAVPGIRAGDAPDELAVLKSYFSSNAGGESAPSERDVARIVFDLGENAMPVLVAGLSHSDEDKTDFAAERLACIGGTNAVAALRGAYRKKPSTLLKSLLCFSLASTGAKPDIDFLIQSLKGEHIGDDWAPIQAAAFSLGVLRAERAKAALEATAKKDEGTSAADAANEALRWMQKGPWETPPLESTEEKEIVVHSVLRNGVPRTEDKRGFHDSSAKRHWTLSGRSWNREPQQESAKGTPSISFDVLVSKDGARAICSVRLDFGPLNASGYDYLLRKKDGKWTVIGMRMTWVS